MNTFNTTTLIMYKKALILYLVSAFFILGCNKIETAKTQNYYTRSDVVATEAAFTVINSSLMETESHFLNAVCDTSETYRTCSNYSGTDFKATYNWNFCSFDNSKITFAGIWRSYYYDDLTGTCPQPLTVGKDTSRLTSIGNSVKYYMSSSDTIEMSTDQYPSFPGQPLGSDGIRTHQFDTSTRKLHIDAIEVKRSNSSGHQIYDVFLQSSSTVGASEITATGTLANSNRVVDGYTYVYFKEQERAKVNFLTVTWGNSACCFPTSGQLVLEFDGYDVSHPTAWPSTSKISTVDFTNTCGHANITDSNLNIHSYIFSECF